MRLWQTCGLSRMAPSIGSCSRPLDEPFEFCHTLEDQIGGQMAAGLCLTGYEDVDIGEGRATSSRSR